MSVYDVLTCWISMCIACNSAAIANASNSLTTNHSADIMCGLNRCLLQFDWIQEFYVAGSCRDGVNGHYFAEPLNPGLRDWLPRQRQGWRHLRSWHKYRRLDANNYFLHLSERRNGQPDSAGKLELLWQISQSKMATSCCGNPIVAFKIKHELITAEGRLPDTSLMHVQPEFPMLNWCREVELVRAFGDLNNLLEQQSNTELMDRKKAQWKDTADYLNSKLESNRFYRKLLKALLVNNIFFAMMISVIIAIKC